MILGGVAIYRISTGSHELTDHSNRSKTPAKPLRDD